MPLWNQQRRTLSAVPRLSETRYSTKGSAREMKKCIMRLRSFT